MISIIEEKKIELFITTETNADYVASYLPKYKFIKINGDCLLNVDLMCESLTHELIHFIQYEMNDCKPLGLEIEDSIVDKIGSSYKNISDVEFIQELESFTYEVCPFFIRKFFYNRNELSELFHYTQERKTTIEWIGRQRRLPKYKKGSRPKQKIDLNKLFF